MRDKHIAEVLQDPAFINAKLFYRNIDDEEFEFTTHYYAHSEELLEEYSNGYGNEMKSDFMAHFGQYNPTATRRVLSFDEELYTS